MTPAASRALALLSCLGAGPATAQDLAAEFTSAADVFAIPGPNRGNDAAATEALLRRDRLVGRWVNMLTFTGNWGAPQDLDTLAQALDRMDEICLRFGFDLEPVGQRSFALRGPSGAEDSIAVSHQFIGGRSYQVAVDEGAYLARMGYTGDNAANVPPSMYETPMIQGTVELFQPSDNVLVIQGEARNADIYLRCPAA